MSLLHPTKFVNGTSPRRPPKPKVAGSNPAGDVSFFCQESTLDLVIAVILDLIRTGSNYCVNKLAPRPALVWPLRLSGKR